MPQNQLLASLTNAISKAGEALVPALKAILSAIAISFEIISNLLKAGLSKF